MGFEGKKREAEIEFSAEYCGGLFTSSWTEGSQKGEGWGAWMWEPLNKSRSENFRSR